MFTTTSALLKYPKVIINLYFFLEHENLILYSQCPRFRKTWHLRECSEVCDSVGFVCFLKKYSCAKIGIYMDIKYCQH